MSSSTGDSMNQRTWVDLCQTFCRSASDPVVSCSSCFASGGNRQVQAAGSGAAKTISAGPQGACTQTERNA